MTLMNTWGRIFFFISFFITATWLPYTANAQCVGLPSVSSLGSNKFPVGLCAPVNAEVTYAITFTAAVPPGTIELIYDWGDASAPEIVPLPGGQKTYNVSRIHNFPQESDCEYHVVMSVRYKGQICTNTNQIQKISSWRTDKYNGGEINLVSPATKTDVHLVCEGENLSVIFEDESDWNCNAQYTMSEGDLIESPNTEYRWQQIVYNAPTTGNKIPHVRVNGVEVTGINGEDLQASYQDPRGIVFMSAPVLHNDARRRPALEITAPGGFGVGFPKAGDVFAITLRYWNFCNPYDDPEIDGPPGDRLNGDHRPIEKTALIRIVAPPQTLKANDQTVCLGTTPSAFSVAGVTGNNLVNWYKYIPGSDVPGDLIVSSKSASLPLSAHPDWKNAATPGVLKVWASQRTNTTGATNCESPRVLVTRTIREDLSVPNPDEIVAEVCNSQTFTITLPTPEIEKAGGATKYTWTGSSGLTIVSTTANTATFKANITNFGTELFAERTVTITRSYVANPVCAKSKSFAIRIHRQAEGGNISGPDQICESDSLKDVRLVGYVGQISRWEVKKDNGAYTRYIGTADKNEIVPGKLQPGSYTFRAIVSNGSCNEIISTEKKIQVYGNPPAAYAGEDQFVCNALRSAALTASNPSPGVGTWSYEASVPSGFPSPTFNAYNPNTTVIIKPEHAGIYTLRWTVTNGPCSSYDDVVIDFGTNPSEPNAGTDKTVCGDNVKLEGNTPEKGQGMWSVVNGPGCSGASCPISIQNLSSPFSLATLNPNSGAYGAYTLRWTISSGGNKCFSKSDDVIVTFQQPIKISASELSKLCLDKNNLQPIELVGMVQGSVKEAEWNNVSGKGIVSESSVTTEGEIKIIRALYHPVVEDYDNAQPISAKLMAKSSNSSCVIEEKVITISFERRPIARAGSDIDNLCESSIKLKADPLTQGTQGTWTATEPGITFSNPNHVDAMASNIPLGTTLLVWTVTNSNGMCASSTDTIRITRVGVPSVSDIIVTECEIQPSKTELTLANYVEPITSLSSQHRKVSWSRGNTSLQDPSLKQENVGNGEVFIARVQDLRTGCYKDAKLTVQVQPLPRVSNAVVTQCEDVAGANIVSGIDLNEIRFAEAITKERNVAITWHHSDEDAVTNRFAIADPIMVNGRKEVFARVISTNAPFCVSIARLDFIVNPQPAVTAIFGKESVCQGSTSSGETKDLPIEVYQVMPIPGAKYYWEIPANESSQFKRFGGGGLNDFYVLLQFPNAYTGKIKVRAEINGCSGPQIEKEIKVSASPSQPVIEGRAIVCENSNYISFNVTPNNFPASTYNWQIQRLADNTTSTAHIVEGQLTGNVLVNFTNEDVIISVRESNASCVSPAATKIVKMAKPPKATLSIDKEISCFMARDGIVKTYVTGGNGPFTSFKIQETGQVDGDKDGVFEHLPQGSYTVRVTDANGCVATSTTQILKQPELLVIDKVSVLTDKYGYNVSCRNAEDGQMTVAFSGGNKKGQYKIALMRGVSNVPIQTLSGTDSVTFKGLQASAYSVIVEDNKGCSSVPSTAFVIGPPVLYAGAIGSDRVICSGNDPGSIEEISKASGGVGAYQYEWQESLTGDMKDDGAWNTLAGETGASLDLPVLINSSNISQHRYYRRVVKSSSRLGLQSQSCEVKSVTGKVTVTVHPTPKVEFTGSSSTVCEGDALSLALKVVAGSAPILFDYTSSADKYVNQTGAAQTTISVANFRKNDVYTLLSVRDANGCNAEALPGPVRANVIKVKPDFTITNTNTQCNGGEFRFNWHAEAGVNYRWEWADGTITSFNADQIKAGLNQVSHAFTSLATGQATEYPVKLFASYPGCIEKMATKPVRISPAIALNILAGDTLLCSGQTTTFYNHSSGVDKGSWYYRKAGSAELLSPTSASNKTASFTLTNKTASNPITYEVVYEAQNNAGCKTTYRKNVVVFRSNVAGFNVDSIPSFENESVEVSFTNTSEVADSDQFEYLWNFGEQGYPKSNTHTPHFPVAFYSPGKKEISLVVNNIEAERAGKVCSSVFRKMIAIPGSELEASFTATPFASCNPVTIKVENTSTGADTYLWQLYREGIIVMTSNLRLPSFQITDAGTYDLKLVVTATETGNTDDAVLKSIQVFEVPDAAFELRSDLIYVPDTPMEILNFSRGGDQYIWDFGDGATSDVFEPVHAYQHDGRYTVTLITGSDQGIIDSDGDGVKDQRLICYDSTTRHVVALLGGSIQIPNAFTPNTNGRTGGHVSNGFNDVFLPKGKGLAQFQMQIYDRWGTLIFETNDQDIGWDGYDRNGKLMSAGVYVYKITARQSSGEKITRVGDVTLIR